MVKGGVNADNAGIRDEAVGGLMADHPAPRGRDADGTALVATDRHVDIVVRQGGPRPPRRTAGAVVGIMLIPGGAVGAGMPTAGKGKVVHIQDRRHLCPGVENPGDNRRVYIRHIAVQDQRGAGHGQSGDTHIVLDAQPFAGQLARRRALDRAAPHDCIQRIVLRTGADSRVTVSIGNRGQIGRFLVQLVQGRKHARQH